MSAVPSRDRVRALVEPVVTDAGYDLEDISVKPAGRRSLVRVVVDGDDGITLDDVATVSRAVADELDRNDGIIGPAPYTLEVTSPGVDRPLTLPRHWRRATGRLVKVTIASTDQVEARVAKADDDGVELDVAGAVRAVAYADLGPGRVQVEFSRRSNSEAEGDAE